MTTILKSNTVATNYIINSSGLKDSDYIVSADFINKKYTIDAAPVGFSDVISYTRVENAFDYIDGNIITVAENTPLFNDPITKQKGLWGATTIGNLLGSSPVTTNQTLTHTLPVRIGVKFILQVFGTGSVTVSGDVTGTTLTATQSNPIIYSSKASAADPNKSVVNFTVAGNIAHYQTNTDFPFAYNKPYLSTVRAPVVKLSANVISKLSVLSGFSLLFRFTPALFATPDKVLGVFELATTKNSVYSFINTQKQFSTGLTNGITPEYATPDILAEGDLTLLVTYSAGQIKIFRNGELLKVKAGDATSVLKHIVFFKTDDFAAARNITAGLLKNVAIYSKTLSDDDAKKLSLSFKW